MTLKHVLQRHTGPQFFRVHKSYIVNLEMMQELKLKDGGQAEIIFKSNKVAPVPVARRRLPDLKKALGV
jgi:two-component system response regulator LytT